MGELDSVSSRDICWHLESVVLSVFANYRSRQGFILHLPSGSGMCHIPAERIRTRPFPHSQVSGMTTRHLHKNKNTPYSWITVLGLVFNVDAISAQCHLFLYWKTVYSTCRTLLGWRNNNSVILRSWSSQLADTSFIKTPIFQKWHY